MLLFMNFMLVSLQVCVFLSIYPYVYIHISIHTQELKCQQLLTNLELHMFF